MLSVGGKGRSRLRLHDLTGEQLPRSAQFDKFFDPGNAGRLTINNRPQDGAVARRTHSSARS